MNLVTEMGVMALGDIPQYDDVARRQGVEDCYAPSRAAAAAARMAKPHLYRAEGYWAASYRGRGCIWRNTQDMRFITVCVVLFAKEIDRQLRYAQTVPPHGLPRGEWRERAGYYWN